MRKIKPYKKNAYRTVDSNGKYIFVECEEKDACEMNRLGWREEYRERAKNAAINRKDAEGNLMDFDPKANPRECSWEEMITLGGEGHLGCEESLEDIVLTKVFTETRMNILHSILPTLSSDELHIIEAEVEGISSREYEKKFGIPRKTYLYRRKKLFSRLRSMIEERELRKGHSFGRL